MRFKTITRLLGVQTRQDSADQQSGSLRQADGAVCWPNGAMSFALPWRSAWGISNLPSSCSTLLGVLGYTTGTHAVILSAGSSKVLIFYSFANGVVGLIPWVAPGTDITLADTGSYSSPVGAWAHSLDASAQWYASPIGRALWIGNGVDQNMYWDGTTLRLLLTTADTGQYARAKVAFPPCTSFVIGEQSIVYGGGNSTGTLPSGTAITATGFTSYLYLGFATVASSAITSVTPYNYGNNWNVESLGSANIWFK